MSLHIHFKLIKASRKNNLLGISKILTDLNHHNQSKEDLDKEVELLDLVLDFLEHQDLKVQLQAEVKPK
jgi:hypothetical protein